MKRQLLITAAALVSATLPLPAQPVLIDQHVDIGVNYEAGAWDLHLHNETDDVEYEPDGAILQVGPEAGGTVPSDPAFSFLGSSGSPVWILPNTQNPALLFLGFGAEELATGLFVGDSVTMSLVSVSGPGEFAVFDFDSFGTPQVVMNSRDGIDGADSRILSAGAHHDLNWAFSAPGTYTVSFEGSGTLVAGSEFTSSGPVDYTFQVVPEPGSLALAGLGVLAIGFLVRRRALN